MDEITIKQEEVNLPNGHKMRVTLLKYGHEYDVHTEQQCRGFFVAPTESSGDCWRTVMFTTHRDIAGAMKEYAGRLESLKKRGF